MKMTIASKPSFGEILVRSLLVGLGYALAGVLAAAIVGSATRLVSTPEDFLIWWFTGSLLALALAPFILHSTWSNQRTALAVWAVIVFVRSLGLLIEGSLFKPASPASTLIGAAIGILIALWVAWLSVLLLSPAEKAPQPAPQPRRTWWYWTWRVLAVGLAYIVFYIVFGAANALLYTRSFYENNPQYGLALPPAGTIFLALLIRGPLFGLGALFITQAADLLRRRAAVWLGLVLFVVGGFGPFVESVFRTMPLGFNLATLVELFLQNFLTGVVAAYLYKQKTE